MKKKIILIVLVIIFSAGLMNLGRRLQNMYSLKQEPSKSSNDISQAIKPNDEIKSGSNIGNSSIEESNNKNDAVNNSNNNDKQQEVKPQPSSSSNKSTNENSSTGQSKNINNTVVNTQTQQPNFFIIDTISTISEKNILAPIYIEYNGETVAQITCKILDASKISYKTNGFGNTVYFSSIDGIRERENGPSSGWCFYINGKKPNLGAGACKLNNGDVLEWKYLKDGISN